MAAVGGRAAIKTEILGPKAKISFNFKKSLLFSILISKRSKDKPSPSARSARPPKSAKDNNLITPGALTTLKFSIFNFEFEFEFSITDVKSKFPPERPLKKLYSVKSGLVKSE